MNTTLKINPTAITILTASILENEGEAAEASSGSEEEVDDSGELDEETDDTEELPK